MANTRYASKRYAKGVCDMCGRADLKLIELRKEVYNQRPTGFLVCSDCWDEDNQQLQLGRYPVDDAQALENPRPDAGVDISRILWGFGPVGNPTTQILGQTGQASISTTVPAPYTASAVRFDGATILNNAALVATDNSFVSMSYWIKTTVAGSNQQPIFGTTGGVFIESYQQLAAPGHFNVEVDVHGGGTVALESNVAQTLGTWVNVIVSMETTGTGRAKLYANDVDVTNLFLDSALVPLFNGQRFVFGASPSDFGGPPPFLSADMADVWIAPGVSLLNVAGVIPEPTRRLFINSAGGPVNPTGFPASAILFSGDATAFATNQGSGGAFTTTGTLTNAPTSPT